MAYYIRLYKSLNKGGDMYNLERRKAYRLRLNYPMKYKINGGNRVYHTLFNNLSLKGIKFMAKESVPKLSDILVELPIENGNNTTDSIVLAGKVVWSVSMGDGNKCYQLGFKFTDLNKDRLKNVVNFIQNKIEKTIKE